jgi:hypothetical protein
MPRMTDNGMLTELRNLLHSEVEIPPEVINRLVLATLLNIDARVRDIEKIAPVVRVMLWVGAAIGASIVGLIWSLITGQAAIVFGGLP